MPSYQVIYTREYNALNDAYNKIELDNNEWIDDVLSDNMTSKEFNEEASSEDSISDEALSKDEDSIEELNYENSSEISNNSEIISEESNDCMMNEEGPDKIVDKSLSREQMPSISREFAPYFNNITKTLMFCWVEKHNISTHAYDELVDIIRHPQFKSTDITTNIRRFRKYRQRLPLLPISQMYFGPGQQVEKNQELWHGDIWKESPRFGKASIKKNEATYNCGDFVIYKESSTRVGCHTCNATKDSWTSDNINLLLISRYHHITNIQFGEISAAPTITRCKEIAAKYGLHIKSPILDELKRERHLQSSHDIYHVMAGKVLRFLKITFDALSSEGKSAFIMC
ncbi:107_t:CDS:2 [Cetraspora pellucida]|uniref:107_t:CDS:1 n=1 Tax=Cetraspora pellucida TaxID=1433469 RepID=A0ACA9L589_9GLOM|nr:107_t:CDS:2 [Cetraspora pellucida]